MSELPKNEGQKERWKHTMSRARQYEEVCARVSEGKDTIEGLRDELQEWLDNMPENLKGGTKADELQVSIDSLEDVITALDEALGIGIDFPGMR